MKFRALNYDYHAEASYCVWEERQKKPLLVIRLQKPKLALPKSRQIETAATAIAATAKFLPPPQQQQGDNVPATVMEVTIDPAPIVGPEETRMHAVEAMEGVMEVRIATDQGVYFVSREKRIRVQSLNYFTIVFNSESPLRFH
jgi:hypothetical protein